MTKNKRTPPVIKPKISYPKPKSKLQVHITPLDVNTKPSGEHNTPVLSHSGYLFGPNAKSYADYIGLDPQWTVAEGIYIIKKRHWKKLKKLGVPVVDLEKEQELRRNANLPEVA